MKKQWCAVHYETIIARTEGKTVITGVPTATDFEEHGLMFLNLAWDTVFDLVLEHDDANRCISDIRDEETDAELSSCYWDAAKRPLSIAHALAQQGAELVLKSQIAAISPYLLVCAPPSTWPSGCDRKGVAFADFHVVDAQDLIRACNTTRNSPLPEAFVTTFNKFRKQRNALFHTVDARLDFSHKEIVRYILRSVQLLRTGQWPQLRREHLEERPAFKAYAIDLVTNRLCQEMLYTIDLLDRSELVEFFAFHKNQRRYICPRCYWDCDKNWGPCRPTTAQLRPNTPTSTNLHCFVCGNDIEVTRCHCQHPGCRGNVINANDDHECLTCSEAQAE